MQIEEVDDEDGFLQLERVWNELSRESARPSFFLSHAWFRCCLAGLPAEVRPLVLLARDGGAIIGIAPLCAHRANWRMFPARVISLLQNQDAPFADLVLAPSHAPRAAAAVLDHLAARPGWQLWSAPKIDRSSTTWQLLNEGLSGRAFVRTPAGSSPVLDTSGGWDPFWNAQSQRFKKTVRNVANRVERLGVIDTLDLAAHATAAECLEVFHAVAAQSWKATLPISITRNQDIARFFAALTSTLHARRQLLLWVLRLDGTPIATEYHVRDGERVYALRSDYDARYREASPGAYLNAHIIRRYFDEGVRTYDMGPGESEYKQRWATGAQEQETFWWFNRTPYGRALYNLERRAVPSLRRARAWWRGTREPVAPGINA